MTSTVAQDELLSRIESLTNEIDAINHPSDYLPFRNKDTDLDYEKLAGRVVSCVTHRKLKPGEDMNSFRERARSLLKSALALDTPLPQIEEAYLDGSGLAGIAPEFALLQGPAPKATEHLAFAFRTLLWSDTAMALSAPHSVNFLERRLLQLFQSELLSSDSAEPQADCYLPFLRDTCRVDLQFLLRHPQYFLTEKRRFLELYAFLYTSQLALALRALSQEPRPRPQYFILEVEKASRDRPCFNDEGYKSVRQAASRLFPILSMLNYFNPDGSRQYPLWRYALALGDAGARRVRGDARIASFAEAFREKRGLTPKVGTDPLRLLVEYSLDQFAKGQSRESMGARYVREFEDHFASPFVETRGRAGAVLVMRQDHLLLSTNLCIGDDEAILFPELMRRFNARGIFWDQDSQVELVNFYRRAGNVNALSDTGDAVYVAKAL